MAYLLTGRPGIGKTTAIRRVAATLGPERCGGFYTEEIRSRHGRTGFRIVTLDGRHGVLASVDSTSATRVGRYGVDLETLDSLGVRSVYESMRAKPVVLIDEIGPMELLSARFRQAVEDVLGSPCMLIGTIVHRSHPAADELKRDPRVQLIDINLHNRDQIPDELLRAMGSSGHRNQKS